MDAGNDGQPATARQKQADFTLLQLATPEGGKTKRQLIVFSIRFAEPPAAGKFFFGPKDFDILHAVDPSTWCLPSISASSRGSSCRCCAR